MIIPNPIIKLDYNPAQDVLVVEWPDVHEYTTSQAAYTLDIIVETVKLYDVKYLLTDTRNGIIDIPEAKYKALILSFAKSLATTRLKKLARVVTASTLREKPINEVRREAQLAVPIKSFDNAEEALAWLVSEKYELS
ncbi:hypothetical protein CLV24_102153 [Pontibacter ummariensis]|uniref:SpoIIAA-like n=1 Tax=Pontibacter ummariensis TaxID=1610492 RepID=A0A239BYY5_9BACT|nr:hypothetical protein [Pontibacter ummariensis]PRY15532.1 hypothetical protein CLV24_102153 [Pontibacter ummariensis]SNS13275.1 hypothetical protein SAMN06296052_102259 [Pontibacter ummariensis]